jgi:hypothetical protein
MDGWMQQKSADDDGRRMLKKARDVPMIVMPMIV